jgi:glycosyltransferase involved in cell wall biosynthesis
MQISVLIPVYNAAPYVRQAVESALAQPETAEVVLVEDASPDDSLAVCQALVAEYPDRVRLFRHPGGENRGAGASRNLAIEKSRYPFIAFLDADDYFLAGRFTVARRVFEEKPYVDGVYEAVGAIAENETVRQRLQDIGMSRALERPTVIEPPLEGSDLFEKSLSTLKGHIHLDGLVIKKSVAEAIEPFDEHLRLHQDTAYVFRLMAKGYLAPGIVDHAVAIRRLHRNNRISAQRSPKANLESRILLADCVISWSLNNVKKSLLPKIVTNFRITHERRYCRQTNESILLYLCIFMRTVSIWMKYPFVWRNQKFWILLSPYPEIAGLIPRRLKDSIKHRLKSERTV